MADCYKQLHMTYSKALNKSVIKYTHVTKSVTDVFLNVKCTSLGFYSCSIALVRLKKELRESHGNMARGPEQGVFQHVLIIVC